MAFQRVRLEEAALGGRAGVRVDSGLGRVGCAGHRVGSGRAGLGSGRAGPGCGRAGASGRVGSGSGRGVCDFEKDKY